MYTSNFGRNYNTYLRFFFHFINNSYVKFGKYYILDLKKLYFKY